MQNVWDRREFKEAGVWYSGGILKFISSDAARRVNYWSI